MSTILIRDLMQVGVPICGEETSLPEVARLLVTRNVAALVVLDEDGNMAGWIGEQHLARVIDGDYKTMTAADIMDENVPVMPPELPAAAAAQLLVDQGISQVFITHHAGGMNYPAAVFTLQDVARVIGGLERAPGVGAGSERPSPIDLFKHRYGLK